MGEQVPPTEEAIIRLDEPCDVEVTAAPIDEPKVCCAMQVILRDITQRKRIENQLKAASAAKDQFLAALSHELRTPMTPVLAAATSLRSDPRLPPDVQEDLAMIARNVTLEKRLIDDLLDLASPRGRSNWSARSSTPPDAFATPPPSSAPISTPATRRW
ncbi:MAG: histidine kinase dimerization/phospho-acceptor domain-containing protein [Anaeromyxobacter sp.]